MIAVLVVSLVSSQAYARSRATEGDTTTQCLWWKERSVINWRQSTLGSQRTPAESEFTAIEASFSAWQDVLSSCGSLSFEQGARSSSRRAEYNEKGPNENLVLFRERRCADVAPRQDPCFADGSCGNTYDCWQFSDGAIGITTTSFDPRNGRILDSDIELNTPTYLFTTVDAPPCVRGAENVSCVAADIRNTMTHEIGHLLGLAHIDEASSTMAPRAMTGETVKRTIDPGSRRFICDVYAKGQPSKTCFTVVLGTESGPAARTGCGAVGATPLVLLSVLLARRRRR
ncbi:MAG: myxosortase-dependent metalloprotease, MXAN_2677/MXAN_2678 family [Myxococcaceae bacterium]|nr:myxosortase-dependent metalloprotease, MXAN_2677/MXAN_2678 family [Myxococcaceae bacterium]